jgi:hypothetical protein
MYKHTTYSPDMPCVTPPPPPQNWEVHSKEPILSQLKTSIRKWQSLKAL